MEKSKIPSRVKTLEHQKVTHRPINKNMKIKDDINLNIRTVLGHSLRRRSKSVTDLRSATQLRSFHPVPLRNVLKPISEKNANKVLPLAKLGTKRPAAATKKEEPSKPKVARVQKIPPYDYKARYNLEVEKHEKLKNKFKENEGIVNKYSNLVVEQESLQRNYNTLLNKHQALEELFNAQKIIYDVTVIEKEKLFVEAERSKVEYQTLVTEHNNLKDQNQALQIKYNDALLANKNLDLELADATLLIADLKNNIQLFKSNLISYEDGRRQLHNQIQDLKGSIRVFCRVRPAMPQESYKMLCNINYIEEDTLEIKKSKESISCITGKSTDLKVEFSFDKVFPPEASQADVFEELSHLIQSALDGYHVCVFAYGQTGAGKTYTMQGENNSKDLGMIPRTVKLIFDKIVQLQNLGWSYVIEVSFLEIYNEVVRDLLDPESRHNLDIRFNDGRGTTVSNLIIKQVTSTEELEELIQTATLNRAVAVTNFNEHSSRSHAVTKITFKGHHDNKVYLGSLNLVDLAGSESAKTSTGERLVETKNINKSLSTLGNVISALRNKETHIPYRNSKLTYLLQSSLGGNSKTLMFVNIAPFEECHMESINALRFATKVKEVHISSKEINIILRF